MSSDQNQDDPSRYQARLESQLDKLDQLSDENARKARRVIERGMRDSWAASTARNHARCLRFLIAHAEDSEELSNNPDAWAASEWNNLVDDVAIDRGVGTGQTRQYAYAARAYVSYSYDAAAEKSDIDTPTVERSSIDEDVVLSRAEVLKLVKSAEHIRDKAMIAVMYEAALRRGALVQLDVGSYEDRRTWATLTVPLDRQGVKTAGGRVKPITWSRGYLERWLDSHPDPDNPDAPLFCSIRAQDAGQRLTTQAVYTQFKRIVERSEFDSERVHPHLLRHSRATAMRASENHGKSDIEQVLDWANGSAMHSRYEHVDQLTEAERVAISMGVDIDDDEQRVFSNCPQCRTSIPPEMDRCPVCLLELDVESPEWWRYYAAVAPDDDPIKQQYKNHPNAAPRISELNPLQIEHIAEKLAAGIVKTRVEPVDGVTVQLPGDHANTGSFADHDEADEAVDIINQINDSRGDIFEESAVEDLIPDEAMREHFVDIIGKKHPD